MDMKNTNNWNLPNFSALTAVSRAIQESLRPLAEITRYVQDTLRPIVEVAKRHRETIISSTITFAKAALAMEAVRKMGDAQFVYWEVMDEDFMVALAEANNVDKTLRELLVKEKFASTKEKNL